MTPESHQTTADPPAQSPTLPAEPIDLEQRLLAEAARLHEEAQGLLDEPGADAAGRAVGGDFERRIVGRAHALSVAPALIKALHQLRGVCGLVVVVGLISATIAGASAAQLALGSEIAGPVNFFWVLAGMLGLHTLALFLWLGILFLRPNAATLGSLGQLAFALGRQITQWLHHGPLPLAAIRASAAVFGVSALGRWTLSAISHALWLSFLTGCLAMVILILSIKQYTFAWETTILSDNTYVALTRAIAVGPDALGFTTPTPQQIRDSHWTKEGRPAGEPREAWSGLLIGSIMAYGLLPRLALLAFSLLAWRRAAARWRLDTTERGYARLESRLEQVAETIGVVDADTAVPTAPAPKPMSFAPAAPGLDGATAILGLEIDAPQTAWPPPVPGIDWLDLGFVDSRDERQRALGRLDGAATGLTVVVCSLAATPDRGTRAFIQTLQETSRRPVALVLTDGQRLRDRASGGEVAQRIADWRRLATEAAVADERVSEIDLDHLTAGSRANLAALVTAKPAAAPASSHLEPAFALIIDHARRWSSQPSVDEQAELHRAIAALYQGEGPSWQALLRARIEGGIDLGNPLGEIKTRVEGLKTSAERMVSLLPERLRKRPRWLAAGAMAGALGCVAAATLVTPVAIAALPAWAGLGAAVSALIQPPDAAAETPVVVDLGGAVGGAALFAVLLELQGRDEATITRLLDEVMGDDDPVIADATAAGVWLGELRRRVDQAVAAERAA